MLDRLIDYFLSEPRRLVTLGAAMVRAGGFLVVAGLVGQVATTTVSAARGLATRARADVALAEVLPHYLSWWMPEGVLGFGLALLLLVTGLVAVRTGRVYQRFLVT